MLSERITSCKEEIHELISKLSKINIKEINSKTVTPWCHCTPGGFVIEFTQVLKKREEERAGGKIEGTGS